MRLAASRCWRAAAQAPTVDALLSRAAYVREPRHKFLRDRPTYNEGGVMPSDYSSGPEEVVTRLRRAEQMIRWPQI